MRAGIALGSNSGDRLGYLRRATGLLADLFGDEPMLFSRIYAAAPVEMSAGAGEFLNGVIEVGTHLPADAIWPELAAIETRLGRPPQRARNLSRSIDLDLLYHGDTMSANGPLLLPHPRLTERAFVLRPLHDIRPDLVLPGRRETIAQLTARLPADQQVIPTEFTWS